MSDATQEFDAIQWPTLPGLSADPTCPAEMHSVLQQALRGCAGLNPPGVLVGDGPCWHLVDARMFEARCRELILNWVNADHRLPAPPGQSDPQLGIRGALLLLSTWCTNAVRPSAAAKQSVTSHSSGPAPLSHPSRRLWDALEGRAGTAPQLIKLLKLRDSDDNIRKRVERMRAAGWDIKNKRNVGYYRLDAPPPPLRDSA